MPSMSAVAVSSNQAYSPIPILPFPQEAPDLTPAVEAIGSLIVASPKQTSKIVRTAGRVALLAGLGWLVAKVFK